MEFYKGMSIMLLFMFFLILFTMIVRFLDMSEANKSRNENILLLYLASGCVSIATIFIVALSMIVEYTG